MKDNFLPSAPLTINWAVTNRCNFKCSHCYSRSDPSEELSFEDLSECIRQAAEAGVLSINFGGGEPLLRRDLLAIARFASGLGMRVSMNSNGYLLDRDMVFRLREHGFTKVGISIDSHLPEVHDNFRGIRGSHERAVKALAFLKEAGIETSLSTVICRINHTDITALVRFALESRVRQLNFHNFKCSGLGYSNKDTLDLSSEEWREFYREALALKEQTSDLEISLDDPIIALLGKHNNTSMVKGSICGKLSLNIKTNGEITPCGFIPVVIGNITKDNLKVLWKSSPVLEKMRHKTPTGKCASCGSYEDCLGGCSARALALTGDMNNPDPHCWRNES
ncbi:MAG: GeoRSP system radical SAM/SPASM protein [Nitrospiraceae bacterium]|nr:MAG: GeoRSP system radical SAM/SPASM protein [Nitrospiraceae bacterium]